MGLTYGDRLVSLGKEPGMRWRFVKGNLVVIALAIVAGFISYAIGLPTIVGALAVLIVYGVWRWRNT